MSDKLDYTKRNPKLLMGDASVESLKGPKLHIFKEDGSPNPWKEPTAQDGENFLKAFSEAFDDMDARDLLYHLGQTAGIMSGALRDVVFAGYAMVMTDTSEYDTDTLVNGFTKYLSDEAPKDEITPENSHDEVLKRFFPNGEKPN